MTSIEFMNEKATELERDSRRHSFVCNSISFQESLMWINKKDILKLIPRRLALF